MVFKAERQDDIASHMSVGAEAESSEDSTLECQHLDI